MEDAKKVVDALAGKSISEIITQGQTNIYFQAKRSLHLCHRVEVAVLSLQVSANRLLLLLQLQVCKNCIIV
jgi:hypothetical protein